MSAEPSVRAALEREWLFFSLVAAYCLIYLAIYPASYSISDESSSLALAQAIRHGSIFLDSPLLGLAVGDHVVSLYSPLHAALLVPALMVWWRLAFLVSAAFFVAGSFVLRGMLRRAGIASGWCALYFMLAGATYYSRTLMAAVPSAAVGLLGVSLCIRDRARPLLGGLALGVATLLHPWMGPLAVAFTIVWSLERAGRRGLSAAAMIAGALPALAVLMAYNHATTGSAFRNAYTILGHQYRFGGEHLASYFTFYILSLAVFPIAGWSAFLRRWSGTWAIPALCATAVVMGSLYYYRDGLNVGSARVGSAALIAGLIPGQRFLIPASMVACYPAARFLSARVSRLPRDFIRAGKIAILAGFAVSFTVMSIAHQSLLKAHARVQDALAALPHDARIATAGDAAKEFAPAAFIFIGAYKFGDDEVVPPDQYFAVLRTPGGEPPSKWTAAHEVIRIPIRSWVWNRDLLIGSPVPR